MQAEKLRECEPIAVDMGQEEPDHEWDRSNERVSGLSKGLCERAQGRPLKTVLGSKSYNWSRTHDTIAIRGDYGATPRGLLRLLRLLRKFRT